jgi:hypothetical protein
MNLFAERGSLGRNLVDKSDSFLVKDDLDHLSTSGWRENKRPVLNLYQRAFNFPPFPAQCIFQNNHMKSDSLSEGPSLA